MADGEDELARRDVRCQSLPLPGGKGVATSLPEVLGGLLVLHKVHELPLCSPVRVPPVDESLETLGDPTEVDDLLVLVTHMVKDDATELVR